MQKNITLLFGILLLFSFTFISAQPWESVQTGSLSIAVVNIDTLPQNTGHHFYIHLTNLTNFLDNSTGQCGLTINTPDGFPSYKNQDVPFHIDSENEWGVTLDANNFTTLGQYYGVWECNTTIQAGTTQFTFFVTPNGKAFTIQNAISYLGFIFIISFFFILTMIGGWLIPWKHKKSDEGKIITINNFRYIKVFMYSMAYLEIMFLMGLSYKFFREAGIEGFTEFFNFVYSFMLNIMYPLIILLVITFFVIWINNRKLSKRLNLGLR